MNGFYRCAIQLIDGLIDLERGGRNGRSRGFVCATGTINEIFEINGSLLCNVNENVQVFFVRFEFQFRGRKSRDRIVCHEKE